MRDAGLLGVRPVRFPVLASVAVFPAVSTALALLTGGALSVAFWVLAGLYGAVWVLIAARTRPQTPEWTPVGGALDDTANHPALLAAARREELR